MKQDVGTITPLNNRMGSTQEFRIANNPGGRINTFVREFSEEENYELYILTSLMNGPDPSAATGEIRKLVPG
jgi:hypothetical protein